MMRLTPEVHSACDSLTNSFTNVQTWKRQTIQLQSVQNCPKHHHPVPQATRLCRNCLMHLVRLLTETWAKGQGRRSELMRIWTSALSKMLTSAKPGSRSSTRHCKHDFPSLMARSNTTQLSLKQSPRLQSCRASKTKGLHRGVRKRQQRKGHQWQVGAETEQSTIRAERLLGKA